MKEQVEVRELKEGRYVIIDEEPCIIKSISHSKPGKHGSAKARVDAIGIFDNQKKSIVQPVTTKIYVPNVERKTGQVLSIGRHLGAAHGPGQLRHSRCSHNRGSEAKDRGRKRGCLPLRHGQDQAGPALGSPSIFKSISCSKSAALPTPTAELEDADYVVVGLPFDCTASFRSGSRDGPDAIRLASFNFESYDSYYDVDLAELAICDLGNMELGSDPATQKRP